jgi:hypothetical protein
MSCPILLTAINAITIDDLGELTLAGGAIANLESILSIEEISNSTDLQTAITAGDATLEYGTDLITDLSDLCITPSELEVFGKADWTWTAGRRGNVTVSGIDLVSVDGAPTQNIPFVSNVACRIEGYVARSNTDQDWTLDILASFNGGLNWAVLATYTINTQTRIQNFSSSSLLLAAGDLVRLRYTRIANSISNPSVTLLMKEI